MRLQAKKLCNLVLGSALMLPGMTAVAEEAARWETNMAPGVTEVGHKIYDLHMAIFWICVVTGVLVFGAMFYSVFAHRKSSGRAPATFHESTKIEIAWTIVPFLILLIMAWPATTTLMEVYNTDDAELDILVTGYQWKWKYEYLDANGGDSVSFFSNLRTAKSEIYNEDNKGENYLLEVDEPVVIPVNTKTRFLVTANDVIHAWWVPDLAVKKDAIPGFINEAWTKPVQTGVYRGQCAELCGRDHGFMPIVVNVVEQGEYVAWLDAKRVEAAEVKELMRKEFTLDELVSRGKDVYDRSCAACHGLQGEGGLGKAIAGSPVATGDLMTHLDIVLNGVPGTAMQAFAGQLNEVDAAAVTVYQRNAFGNNMGDMLQPVDVFKFKKGK